MKFKIIFTVFLSILYSQLNAQHIPDQPDYKMPQIIGQTPDVASLLKFSETSVANSTGIPNISIPFFTLASGDLSASVGISYHAGGIRVSEDASSVGLGWSLMAGGQITRTIKSHPDDRAPFGYIYNPYTVDYIYNLCHNGLTDSQDRDCHWYTGGMAETLRYDYEPDEFNYSMLGLSGRFMFNQDRTNNPKGEIVQFPYKNVIITPIFVGDHIVEWNITDDSGTLYHFVKGNSHYKTSYYQKINGQLEINIPEFTPEYIETWNLASVTSYNGEIITFNYITPELLDGPGGTNYNEYNFMESSDALVVQIGEDTSNNNNQPNYLPRKVNQFSATERIYTTLKSIVTSTGKVEIIYDTQHRVDMQSEKFSIKFIELYDNHDKLLKKVELKHSYFISDPLTIEYFFLNNSQQMQNTLIKRLRLDEVEFSGYVSNLLPSSENRYSYIFDYNDTKLPHKRSYAQDHWGYYNGVTGNVSLISAPNYSSIFLANREVDTLFSKASVLKSIKFPEGGKTEYVFENNSDNSFDPLSPYITTQVIFQDDPNTPHTIVQNGNETIYSFRKNFTIGNDAKPEGVSSQALLNFTGSTTRCPNNMDEIFNIGNLVCDKILLKIYKITNGQQGQLIHSGHIWANNTITVEKNKEYRAIIEITSSSEENYDFIVNSSQANLSWEIDNTNQSQMNYFGGLRIKEIKNYDQENNIVTHKKFKYKGGKILSKPSYFSVTAGNVRKFVSQSWVPLLTSQSGYVHYSDVQEYFINNSGEIQNPLTEEVQNSIFRKYSNNSPPPDFPTAPFIWDSYLGLLLEENTSNIKITTNTFTSHVSQLTQPVKGFIISRPYFIDEAISPFNNSYLELLNCLNNGVCDITPNLYTLNSVSRLLISQSKETKIYDNYNYINSLFESTEFFYNSFNPELNLVSKVETQASDGSLIQSNFKYAHDFGDQNLISSNRVSVPLLTSSYKNTLLTNSVKANYNDFENRYRLDNIETLKTGNSFEERLKYYKYNSLGKPIDISTTEGTHIFYIYGYNSNYPIAKINNFTYIESLQVQNLINAAVLASNLDDDTSIDNSGKEGLLRSALSNLRSHSALSNAQVTTYTYDPLVGITSVTDSRNYTIFYQYDNFGRLKSVKDVDGNILSENDYNYRPQPQN